MNDDPMSEFIASLDSARTPPPRVSAVNVVLDPREVDEFVLRFIRAKNSGDSLCLVMPPGADALHYTDVDIQSFDKLTEDEYSSQKKYSRPASDYETILIVETVAVNQLESFIDSLVKKAFSNLTIVTVNLEMKKKPVDYTEAEMKEHMTKFCAQPLEHIFESIFSADNDVDTSRLTIRHVNLCNTRRPSEENLGDNFEDVLEAYLGLVDSAVWLRDNKQPDLTKVVRKRLFENSDENFQKGDYIFVSSMSHGERTNLAAGDIEFSYGTFYGRSRFEIVDITAQCVRLSSLVPADIQKYCTDFRDKVLFCKVFSLKHCCGDDRCKDNKFTLQVFEKCSVNMGKFVAGCQTQLWVDIDGERVVNIESVHYSIFKQKLQQKLFHFKNLSSSVGFGYEIDNAGGLVGSSGGGMSRKAFSRRDGEFFKNSY